MTHCLILNSDYQPLSWLPLSTITWQQAVKLHFLDRIKILEFYDDWTIHSPSTTIRVPALAVTKGYQSQTKNVRFSRRNIYIRDLYQCQYCGDTFDTKELNIDHVIPVSKGGKTNWENCCTSCIPCNAKKSDKIIKPLRVPFKPSYYDLAKYRQYYNYDIKHPSWRDYIT